MRDRFIIKYCDNKSAEFYSIVFGGPVTVKHFKRMLEEVKTQGNNIDIFNKTEFRVKYNIIKFEKTKADAIITVKGKEEA